MNKFFRLNLVIFILLIIAVPAIAQTYFSARLTRQQVPGFGDTTSIGTDNSYRGTAVFVLDNTDANPGDGETRSNNLRFIITINGAVSDTSAGGDTTGAASGVLQSIRFQVGAIGDTGRTVFSVTEGIRGNSFSGSWSTGDDAQSLSEDLVNELAKGNIYVTAVTDSGEIRGQVHPASGAGSVAHLTGPQKPDSVATEASGVGSFLLTDIGLVYLISVEGLNVTGGAIHMGDPGVEGPALRPITFNGHTAFGVWGATADDTLGRLVKRKYLAEALYVNVQSQNYPNGEIRGQILHAGGFGFFSPLTKNRADTSGAGTDSTLPSRLTGNGSYTLTDRGLVYHINLKTNGQNATLYLSNELTNERIIDLPPIMDSTISDAWLTDDSLSPMTDQHVAELLRGRLSLVALVGNDTLRGRILPFKQTNFTAMISGPQERPQKVTRGSGVGHFILTDRGLRYYITVSGIDTIAAAHFHMAPVGVNGGVVEPIRFDSNHTAFGIWSRTGTNALTDDMIDAILKGDIYVNIHTPRYPDGEIRGQLVPASGTDFKSHLVSRQNNTAIATGPTGTGNFILSNEGLVYKVTMDSLQIAGIDFVQGAIGESGSVINSINVGADTGNTIVGVWRRNGGGNQSLTDTLINAMLNGDVYLSVRTSDNNASGTIRGQLLPNGGWGFVSVFNPFGPDGSASAFENSTGSAIYTLTDAGLRYDIIAEGFNGNSAGIYSGQAGAASGSLVHQLTGNFSRRISRGSWLMVNDSAAAAYLPELFTNGLFVRLQPDDTTNDGRFSAQITRNFEIPLVSVSRDNSAPRSFTLEQNYPNPFNPSTTIKFSIPENGSIKLAIYNIIGEEVATLINGQDFKAGNYQFVFDGSRLASGVYFYRLSFNNNTTVRKMLLLK